MRRRLADSPLRSALPAFFVALLLGACSPSSAEDTALARGDAAFARDSLQEALAEYLLAVRQGRQDAEALTRVAHTYARLNRVDEAQDYYARAVRDDGGVADQAAADFVHMARQAADAGDRFLMASAIDAALAIRPGIGLEDLALPLARHYYESGEYGRALPFYQEALAATGEAQPELVREIAQAHQQIGNCEQALVFFEQYRELVEPARRGEVDFDIGDCSLRLARDRFARARSAEPARRVELLEDALRRVDRSIDLGESRVQLASAWFEKGQILASLGDCERAVDAFRAVQTIEGRNTGLARRAAERIDQLRFGRGLSGLTSSGDCG